MPPTSPVAQQESPVFTVSPLNEIRNLITREEKKIRTTYPILSYQNTIGVGIWCSSFVAMVLSSVGWYYGYLHWSLMILINAIATSLLHELEHDLIHDLYFKELPIIQHLMFFGIWIAKIGVAPWWRKEAHLKHHKESGQVTDIEERLIGLGLPFFSPVRLLMLMMPVFGTWFVAFPLARDEPKFSIVKLFFAALPVWFGTTSLLVTIFNQFYPAFFAAYLTPHMLNVLFVVAMTMHAPNTFRQACLQVVSVSCHYYADIPKNDPFYQTQILDTPVFYPLQVFCFNFGATHSIHHFIAKQPFYLRQMIAPEVLDHMQKLGVRRNDIATLFRNNNYYPTETK